MEPLSEQTIVKGNISILIFKRITRPSKMIQPLSLFITRCPEFPIITLAKLLPANPTWIGQDPSGAGMLFQFAMSRGVNVHRTASEVKFTMFDQDRTGVQFRAVASASFSDLQTPVDEFGGTIVNCDSGDTKDYLQGK